MPEIAINKDNHPLLSKSEVGFSRYREMPPPSFYASGSKKSD